MLTEDLCRSQALILLLEAMALLISGQEMWMASTTGYRGDGLDAAVGRFIAPAQVRLVTILHSRAILLFLLGRAGDIQTMRVSTLGSGNGCSGGRDDG